jgi:3-oxoadipate enol-lactonase/4-carboxymuconolactone decarboxylase
MNLNVRLDGPADAPLLVLGPSLGTSLDVWEPCLGALAQSWRVLRYDLPGHGGSPAVDGPITIDDIAAAVLTVVDDAAPDGRFVAGGISIGGAIALTLALAAPARVSGLLLCCTSARFGEPATWAERAAQVRAEGTGWMVPGALRRWFADENAAPAERTARMLRDTDPVSYAACCDALGAYDTRDRLAEVRAPALVIAGADDPATPVAHAEILSSGIPAARLAVIPGAAHLAPLERPGEAVRHIAPFLKHGAGMEVRREVLGDAHVDRANHAITGFTADFQDLITRYAWGEIWTRPGLDRKTRSCVTLTALVAHNHLTELAMHVRAALRNGLTPDEIKEVLLQTAIYCGVPAANAAFAVAQRVLTEETSG